MRSLVAIFLAASAAGAAGRVVLLADHGKLGEIVAIEWPSGKELWSTPNKRGHDVQPLKKGHVLYTTGEGGDAIEMDAAHKPVWTYGAAEGLRHPISAERLANGNTLIGDARIGKVIEVTPAKKIVWTYESADLANMRMRNSRRTSKGTTLIAVEAAGKIIEVNRAGEIVWSFEGEGGAKRKPYRAVRLKSGNTLVAMTAPGELVEVTPKGATARSYGGYVWVSGFDVLKGGNVLVNDYQGHRIVELAPDGRVVHELKLPARSMASIAVVD